jgi:hypothetical protein
MIVLLAAVAALWYGGEFEREQTLEPEGPPAFVSTVYARATADDGASVIDRLRILYYNIKTRLVDRSDRGLYPFPPQLDGLYDVHSLLNHCMEASGTRYFLAREGIADAIDFTDTNTWGSAAWIASLEAALQRNGYELIREKPKLVKVVPQHKLEDYRKAGLLKSTK